MPRLALYSSLALLAASIAAVPASALAQGAETEAEAAFIIVNPAGRGNQSQAQAFLSDFAGALCASWPGDAGPCPRWRGHYHVNQADALASIRGSRPVLGLLSPGFYLAVDELLAVEPRAVPVLAGPGGAETMRLVARAESAAARQLLRGSVQGLRLGGQLVGEPRWTRRVLLAGLEGADEARLHPQARTLAAVRKLQDGELDGVLLVDKEWRRLDELGMAAGLAAVHSATDLLAGPLAILGLPEEDRSEVDEARRAARRRLGEAAAAAALRFAETEAGREVLDTMGLENFAPVSEDDYHRLAALYSGASGEP